MKFGRVVILSLAACAAAWGQAAGDTLGQSLLDRHQWEQAAQEFDRVAAKGGSQADSALYWRAYALNKLEFRGEALASLADLRKAYPMSRWLQDAAALEMEIKRAAGQNVTPESQSGDEMKLLALNGLMRSDPERAVPVVEGLFMQAQSAALKREALYVLAQSPLMKAQQLLEQVARGKVDPALQALAVRYMVEQRQNRGDLGPLLFEIYNSSTDAGVKQAAVNGLSAIGDTRYLPQIPRADILASNQGTSMQAALEQLAVAVAQMRQQDRYKQAKSQEDKLFYYQSQKDRNAKQEVIDGWASQKNTEGVKMLISIARVETDPYLKRKIVEHLIDLNTPEAREYLLEILK
ncbi:MAG TPA: hypothetical protein VGG72_12680 [Bryobacteraceae bacterium]|jgi:hypothetical protein